MDVSGLVSDLRGGGSDYLGVYVSASMLPVGAGEPRFEFSGAVLDATLTPSPEPSSIAIAFFGGMLLVGYRLRVKVKHR
jgi:hypothetical protein